jgi:hypothetical protein
VIEKQKVLLLPPRVAPQDMLHALGSSRLPVRLSNRRRSPIAMITKAKFVVDENGVVASPEVYDWYTHPDLDEWYRRESLYRQNELRNELEREQQAKYTEHWNHQTTHYAAHGVGGLILIVVFIWWGIQALLNY